MTILSGSIFERDYKFIFDVVRTIASLDFANNKKITQSDAIRTIQTSLFYLKYENVIEDGKTLTETCIELEPNSLKDNFDNVDELIKRLCNRRTTQLVFDKIKKKLNNYF
ncbi:unnamed protein product [Rotaria magnacalcarata]|uniref:Uncharacterized protein n=1 Tax=Rotaria magnacalcarata TaxID=392030 RepID=A0A816RPI6_9BILA|nr:unnamed protein product [Rotaria magnacalcarata]CAF2142420.1 unnamed protein product [Rotaria magnacalcarata]